MKLSEIRSNRRTRKYWKSLVRTIWSLVLVAAFLSGMTYTWYVHNRQAEEETAPIYTEEGPPVLCEGYLIYGKTEIEGQAAQYSVENSLVHYTMNAYDSVFGKNDATPVILRVPVSGTSILARQSLTITLDRVNDATISTDEYGLNNTETKLIQNYLSNISEYKIAVIPELNVYEESDAKGIYELARSYFDDREKTQEAKAFAVSEQEGNRFTMQKNTNILNWTLTGTEYTNAVTADGVLYVYIQINYSQNLIAAYLQNHDGDFASSRLDQTDVLKFDGDLNTLSFTASGN